MSKQISVRLGDVPYELMLDLQEQFQNEVPGSRVTKSEIINIAIVSLHNKYNKK